MLPIPVLDDETFQQIAEHARSMIPRLCPSWTDFNYHDPGITFLELFAFLKESQQYHLDQIGPQNRQKYRKLLGMTQQRRSPARSGAVIRGEKETFLPRGTRLMAGEIPFETQDAAELSGCMLLGGFCLEEDRKIGFDSRLSSEPGSQHLEIFGRQPHPGAVWYLRFQNFPAENFPLHLHFWMEQGGLVPRNPAPDGMVPLVTLCWEYLNEEGWKPFTVLKDETQGLLFSGDLVLQGDFSCRTSVRTGEEELLPEEGAWIRVRLAEGEYDLPPVVTGLCSEMTAVMQMETAAEMLRVPAEDGKFSETGLLAQTGAYAAYLRGADGFWREQTVSREQTAFGADFRLEQEEDAEVLLLLWRENFETRRHLGTGNGFPGQSRELGHSGQIGGKFALLVAEADEPDAWSIWQRVESFDASGPEDRHYILEEEEGILSFGDCIHGMAPEGEILIAAEAVTLGSAGNVKAGRIDRIHEEDLRFCGLSQETLSVRNPDDAAGGTDAESLDHCFARCRKMLRQSERAVTYADYERLVKETPGLMIAGCKAVPVTELPRQDGSFEENCVTIVVEPASVQAGRPLSPAYSRNILRYLEDRRMLGTKISLISPEYISITVYAEILSMPHYVDAKSRIQAAIAEFFRSGWEFGRPVRYSELYGIIDTLDCVQSIESLTVEAQGRGISRSIGGDVILPFNGMAVLKQTGCQVRPAE